MAYVVTTDEYLEVDGYPLATPAVRLLDLSGLWLVQRRGTNVLIPGVAGVVGTPGRRNVIRAALPGAVFGELDAEGVAHPGVREGLEANLGELISMVAEPVASGDGTRTARWYRADGSTHTAPMQVLTFEPRSMGPTTYRFTLTVEFLSAWTEETP